MCLFPEKNGRGAEAEHLDVLKFTAVGDLH